MKTLRFMVVQTNEVLEDNNSRTRPCYPERSDEKKKTWEAKLDLEECPAGMEC